MADLLQSQIQESCRLALPEGLKDLMCDISREVLRAQPTNLFKFIADYLSVLLVTRENLTIASRVCKDLCFCECQPELERELRNIGMYDEDIPVATDIILEHFYNGEVHEANIMMEILKQTEIDQDQLLKVQAAIRNAFMRHQVNHITIYESSSESEKDEIDCAVHHTLRLYEKTKPTYEECETMAKKIQTAYRAYGVRRYCQSKRRAAQEQGKAKDKNVKLVLPENKIYDTTCEEEDRHVSSSFTGKTKLYTASSTSLAGSYMRLPRYKPYSAHDTELLSDLEETPEKEHAHIDYTVENPHVSITIDTPVYRERKINFVAEDDIVSVPEITEEIHEVIDDELKENIDEEIVETDGNESDFNDDIVVAIDLDVEPHSIVIETDDDNTVKSDDDIQFGDEDIGTGHEIEDNVMEYVMNDDLCRVFDEDGSGHAL